EGGGGGGGVEDGVDGGVELVTRGQEFVQLNFTQHGTKSGLGKLLGLPVVVLHLDYGLRGIDHPPINDGIDLQSNVVAGDDVLRGDLQSLLAEIDANHAVDGGKNQNDARSLGVRQQAAQPEDHAALILAQDLDGINDVQQKDDDYGEQEDLHSASIW